MAGLAVSNVDFRIVQNAQNHLTSRYELVNLSEPSVVLRRGQSFTIQVHFRNGYYDRNVHGLSIIFDHWKASNPSTHIGTRGEAILDNDAIFGWQASMKENHGNNIVIQVHSPPNAPVGMWTAKFVTWYQQRFQHEYTYPRHIYLLFHPWNSADQVYMPEPQLLDEYAYNDVGKLYQKKGEKVVGDPWVFGQFDMTALIASVKALSFSGLMAHEFRDPVKVTRAVTYMANSMENRNGILVGKWDPPFEPGTTEPKEWTSSLDILKKYLQTGQPVRYGQCWVFAGIVTTVCRALGLACRAVTMIDSPHDGNGDLAISQYYDENSEKKKHSIYAPGEDTEWSFHVWNEVWMARPDLQRGYDGWQAIDGTPQSLSDGKPQCGPAPLEAIKKGHTGVKHDVETFIAASNGDLIVWKQTNGQFKIMKSEISKYGTALWTKKPYTFDPHGDTDRENVIHQYKFPEGSQGERLYLMNAVGQNDKARVVYNVPRQPWENFMAIEALQAPYVPLGQDLVIPFKLKNKTGSERHVRATISAESRYYHGSKGYDIGKVEANMRLKPGQEHTMVLRLSQRDYAGRLVDYGAVIAYGALSIVNSAETWIKQIETGFHVPGINFLPLGQVQPNQQNTLRFTVRNPMNMALTGCRFLFFAPDVDVVREMPFRVINPQEDVAIQMNFRPLKQGTLTFTATLKCREVVDFSGRIQIRV